MTLLYPACPAQHRHASRNTRMLGIVCMLSQLVWIRPQGRSDAFRGCGSSSGKTYKFFFVLDGPSATNGWCAKNEV